MGTLPAATVAGSGPTCPATIHFQTSRPWEILLRTLAVMMAAATVVGCATTLPERGQVEGPTVPPHVVPTPAAAPERPMTGPEGLLPLSALDGWSTDDHAAALAAFRAGCAAVKDPTLRPACAAAKSLTSQTDSEARRFFERHFRAEQLPGEGVLTGYFAPVYAARRVREAPFTAPVRPPPPASAMIRPLTVVSLAAAPSTPAASQPPPVPPPLDLDALAAGGSAPIKTADPVGDLLASSGTAPAIAPPAVSPTPPPLQPPADPVRLRDAERAMIDQAPTDDVTLWMRPEDLFFMQIQGSGVLVLPGGARVRAAYAGDNGKPFVGIARIMARQGLLPPNGTSGDAIRTWLSSHAGDEADAVMRRNPRYVFFRVSGDNGAEPVGAAGVPLPAGRAIAMDSSHHQFGELYWISADAPVLQSAAAHYRRLAVALDTGGAIRGPIRADLYFGTGDEAGREAGNVRHTLHLARLVPVDPSGEEAGHAAPPAPGRR